MYKMLLKNYIDKLKKEDVIKFISANNYEVTEQEIDTIYFYIKNYWEDFYDNKKEIWKKLEKDIHHNTYLEIQNLFQKYRKLIN